MKPRSRTTNPNLFHGKKEFRKVLSERTKLPQKEIDQFFTKVDSEFSYLNERHYHSCLERGRESGASKWDVQKDLSILSLRLSQVNRKPFSELVSPYCDIKTGDPTELGKTLMMSPLLAKETNSPYSRLLRIMHSLEDRGVYFTDMVKYSYDAFGYARSGITSSTGGEPLLWLPLGNSLFLSKVVERLQNCEDAVTIVNLGAGPGALESMVLSLASELQGRLKVISVEQDKASIEILKQKMAGSSLRWELIEGSYTERDVLDQAWDSVDGRPFILSGFSVHHISPWKIGAILSWASDLSKRGGLAQIHDVSGDRLGGGQSAVNRLFFNFMPLYHLSVFYPDGFFTSEGFSDMKPMVSACSFAQYPSLFHQGTDHRNAFRMVENGTLRVFRTGSQGG